MKAFMFFLAFAVIMFCVIIYQQNTGLFIQSLQDIKNIADDVADAGALSADDHYNVDPALAEERALEYLGFQCSVIGKDINDFGLTTNTLSVSSEYGITLVYKPYSVTASSIYEWVAH